MAPPRSLMTDLEWRQRRAEKDRARSAAKRSRERYERMRRDNPERYEQIKAAALAAYHRNKPERVESLCGWRSCAGKTCGNCLAVRTRRWHEIARLERPRQDPADSELGKLVRDVLEERVRGR